MRPKFSTSTAPRNILNLPQDQIDAFRLGWASGQIDMAIRYFRSVGRPLTDVDITKLHNRIMEGLKHGKR